MKSTIQPNESKKLPDELTDRELGEVCAGVAPRYFVDRNGNIVIKGCTEPPFLPGGTYGNPAPLPRTYFRRRY